MWIQKIKYIWRGHITNWPWRDRLTRRNVRNCARTEMQLDYLSKYIPFIKSMVPERETVESDGIDREKAFTIWLQGIDKAPEIVKKCVESIKKFFGDRLIVLDETSLDDYVSVPPAIKEKLKTGKMLPAHFSDIVRLELLYRHGGYWFDSTDFLTSYPPQEITEADFLVFLTTKNLLLHTFIQNYFIRAKKGDQLLAMWRNLVLEYWMNEDKAVSYYLVQLLFKLLVENNTYARKEFEKMPKITIEPSQKLWHETGNTPFSQELYRNLRDGFFFQKCTYKKKTGIIREIIPGSLCDHFINSE